MLFLESPCWGFSKQETDQDFKKRECSNEHDEKSLKPSDFQRVVSIQHQNLEWDGLTWCTESPVKSFSDAQSSCWDVNIFSLFFLSSISSSSCILKDYILKKGSFYSLRDAGINKLTFSFLLPEFHPKSISLNLLKRFFWGFPGVSVGEESACNSGDSCLIPGWEDPLEKEVTTHSSILAWEILWTEEPGGLQSMGSQESTWHRD